MSPSISHFTDLATSTIWVVSALLLARHGALAALETRHVIRERRALAPSRSASARSLRKPIQHASVTVIIPAHNEEAVIEASTRAAIHSNYPDLRVLLVDDGSTDGTAEVARALAEQDARVSVLSYTPNRGKAGALNAALGVIETPVVVCIDADTLLEPDAVLLLVRRLLLRDETAAVAGTVRVGNRRNLLTACQDVEYLARCERRRAEETLGVLTTIPGAIGAFRRERLLAVGGYPEAGLIEDTMVTVKLLLARNAIAACPAARGWTEAPETLSALARQRSRWKRGFLQVVKGASELPMLAALDLLLVEVIGPILVPLLAGLGFLLVGSRATLLFCAVALCLDHFLFVLRALRHGVGWRLMVAYPLLRIAVTAFDLVHTTRALFHRERRLGKRKVCETWDTPRLGGLAQGYLVGGATGSEDLDARVLSGLPKA